jgi:hypothetical protein
MRNAVASKKIAQICIVAITALFACAPAHAEIAMLMEEPYGTFGHLNPTGHAAVYFNHICASAPTVLRSCRPGESGVVISRYHRVAGYDWIAIPLIPYLYAVDKTSEIPATATPEIEAHLRDAYRRRYLRELAPDGPNGTMPPGDWTQLVGASYDRKIFGLNMVTSPELDAVFIGIFNDRSNTGSFHILYRNCADFTRTVVNIFFPNAIHRNFIGDAGIMTPKQAAKSLVKYGKKHPTIQMSAFVIPQVPGTIERSRHVDGVTEAFVKSKKYVIPLSILAPEFTGGVALTYVTRDRFTFPKDASVLSGSELVKAEEAPAATLPLLVPKPPTTGNAAATTATAPKPNP